jgi:hypothetical protein
MKATKSIFRHFIRECHFALKVGSVLDGQMSPETLAKTRLEVIDGEGLEEVKGELNRSELTIRMTL